MDLEEECSKSKPEELDDGKKDETLEKISHCDEIKVEINGDVGHEEQAETGLAIETEQEDIVGVEVEDGIPTESVGADPREAKENGDGIGVEHAGKSPSESIGSPASEVDSSKLTPAKGHGLKKWRRIRRDLSKDATAGTDPSLILKRRLPLAESTKARDGNKQKSDTEGEGPVASPDSIIPSDAPHEVVSGVLDLEVGLLVASSGFSVGVDSDNSEERSSKSSTAASAPRLRHESVGFGRERSRPRGLGGRGSGHAVQQRGQWGRGGGVDASKKFRGDRFLFEKENSHSSSESDLRSSNAAFVRWGSVVSSNGKQINDDGEHSDEAQTFEEIRSGFYKENGRVGDSTGEDLDTDVLEENIEKNEYQPHTDLDPFVESIILLQAAQEALEKEIQKIGEIGKEPISEDSNGQLEGTEESSSPPLDVHSLELTQKIEHLECKLEEASATIDAKESKVTKLEAIINRTHLPKEETASTDPPFLQDEFELDGLFKKKIESEIELLITARATQSWKVMSEDQTALFEAQKSLVEDQAQMMIKLRNAEDRAVVLMKQAEELEARCKELLGTEEALKLQNKVCKLSLCCFVQLVMLCLAFWWFLMKLLPRSDGVVPT